TTTVSNKAQVRKSAPTKAEKFRRFPSSVLSLFEPSSLWSLRSLYLRRIFMASPLAAATADHLPACG
ncbi:MAG: hypothetical protein JZU67_02515, partial [Burkholderiaceae bacterium]|nr:hypothetical protein [Burkholderiaceae bacterium]